MVIIFTVMPGFEHPSSKCEKYRQGRIKVKTPIFHNGGPYLRYNESRPQNLLKTTSYTQAYFPLAEIKKGKNISMKSRPRIKFLQLPHSVAQRIESLTNRTAAALLTYLCRKTIGFGQGVVELSYQQLSQNLKVDTRTVARAAKILESSGDILRDRPAGGVYQWTVLLDKDEVIADPGQTYSTRPKKQGGVMIDRSTPSRQIDHDPQDRSIMTPPQKIEHAKSGKFEEQSPQTEQPEDSLKKLIKDKDLKKQHLEDPSARCTGGAPQVRQRCVTGAPAVHQPEPSVSKTDDEPLHKICLKGLRQHGVSQRVARKLCNDHDHELILSVLKTAPQRPGIQNLAAYIVSEIQDGGYEQPSGEQKNGHQVSGGRSNYAHLTNKKIKALRHKTVKDITPIDAPISYRSVQETRTEQQALETKRLEKEQDYQNKSRQLANRFKDLSEDLQLRLKLVASVHLSKLLPDSEKREEMLRDKIFRRMANRTVLESFFEWVDKGLDEIQALHQMESPIAA